MNLKDRLDNIKKSDVISIKNENLMFGFENLNNLFVNDSNINNLLCNLLNAKKNLIYISDKSIDREIVNHYLYSLFQNQGSVIINNIENNIVNLHNRVNIIADVSTKDAVKVFEYILYGFQSFVFGLNFASNENLIEKLKTVISLNYPNLTEKNINTLIGSSNSVFVCVEKNQDGLLFISDIAKLNYTNENIELESILNSVKKPENIMLSNENIEDKIIEDLTLDEGSKDLPVELETESIIEKLPIVDEELKLNIEDKKNKYKRLKEKVKNKRNL